MKRILTISVTLALLAACPSSHAVTAPEPPVDPSYASVSTQTPLQKLWKEYEAALEMDLPRTQLDILAKIRAEAGRRRLPWDYYRAALAEYETGARINWKDRDSLSRKLSEQVEEYDEAVMTLYHMQRFGRFTAEQEKEYVRSHSAALKADLHIGFAGNDWRVSRSGWQNALLNAFKTDYDYAVWALGMDGEAESLFKGRYPLDALYELESAAGPGEDFDARYAGKAVCLAVRKRDMERRLLMLKESRAATQEDFRALRDEVTSFELCRGKFRGDEKLVADNCSCTHIAEELDSRSVDCGIRDGVLAAVFRNTQSACLTISGGKTKLFEQRLINNRCSYYLPDTVRIQLPAMPDGEYLMQWGSDGLPDRQGRYRKYTVSLSCHTDARGTAVFVADYLSGRPLEKVDIILYGRNGGILAEADDVCLSADGYTYLPGRLEALIREQDDALRLQCRSGARLSGMVYTGIRRQTDISNSGELKCAIITDRRAFNPGETVHFKCLVSKGSYGKTCPGAGVKLRVELLDAAGDVKAERVLETDRWGSADGQFVLTRSERNGNYVIKAFVCDRYTGQTSVTVDDFVLPAFDLAFDDGPTALTLPQDSVGVSGSIVSYSGRPTDAYSVRYSVSCNGEKELSGTLDTDGSGHFSLKVPVSDDGWWQYYQFSITVSDGTGRTLEFGRGIQLSRPWVEDPDDSGAPELYSFRDIPDEPLGIDVTAGRLPVWMSVEVYGQGDVLLSRSLKQFSPENETSPAECRVVFEHRDNWPQSVTLRLLYFQNGDCHQSSRTHTREDHSLDLPLSFERFTESAGPSTVCSIGIRTLPGVQCAVAVFDRSTEQICPNVWEALRNEAYPAPGVWPSVSPGCEEGGSGYIAVPVRSLLSKSAPDNGAALDSALSAEVPETNSSGGHLRSVFANTIAWEPALQTDAEGRAVLEFTTSDKLSTYCVQVYAQDAQMHNSVLRREMTVTLPVQISIAPPQFLYAGDAYSAAVTLSNSGDAAARGMLEINGVATPVTVPAHSSVLISSDVQVPASEDRLYVTARFSPDDALVGADAVRVGIPVVPNRQVLNEAHSGVLLYGMSRDSLENALRSQFVNVPGSGAVCTLRDIRQCVLDALPREVVPRSDNIVDLCRAAHARALLGYGPDEQMMQKIGACRCSDGGFAWFPGMDSSPVLTAWVLEEMEGMLASPETAVEYLDKYMTSVQNRPAWVIPLTMEQYMYVRSKYAHLPFRCRFSAAQKKFARDFLVPSGERGLNADLAAKLRRVLTLRNLTDSDGGRALAKEWGVRILTSGRIRASLAADVNSLAQYAVPHRSGGVYFPNLVMPWRGLLESEVYAHSLMCSVFDGGSRQDIADGIRLWLMIQKETQDWSDPAYILALRTVLDGSESVLATSVMALSSPFCVPFADVRETGNGFSVSVSVPVCEELRTDGPALPGELVTGDKVKLSVKLHSEENRSFVRVSIPVPASLRPVRQLSGYSRGAYRNVLENRIEYWFDVFPEGELTIEEEFFVTQAGDFQSPPSWVECLYAPHYRANCAAPAPLHSGLH